MKVVNNIRIGKPQVKVDTPSHTRGVNEGNKPGSEKKQPGIKPEGDKATGTARRSTGINSKSRNAILPEMPNLSPS
jgi:hypothetical protein